jgi:hypothetical protein
VPEDAWLRKSGQAWKIDAAIVAGLIAIVVPRLVPRDARNAIAGFWLIEPGGLILWAWLSLWVRCASCGTRMAWWAATTLPLWKWYQGLARLQACPTCRDRGDGTKEPIEPPPSKPFSDRRWS